MFVQTEITTDQLDGRHAHIRQRQVVAFLGIFAGPAQQVWLPGNDLLQHYNCTDQPAAAQPAPPSGEGGGAAAKASTNPQPQHPGSQDNGNGKLVLPQPNRLHEVFKIGTIRPSSANDAFDPALWATTKFVSTTIGLEVPVLYSLPRLNNSPLA